MSIKLDDTLARRLMSMDKSYFVFGAIAMFFIGFTFLFVLFVNIGAGQEQTRSYVDMLTVGFFGAFAFSTILAAQRKRKAMEAQADIFESFSPLSVRNQLSTVLPVGLMAGIFVVMINLSVGVGGNLLLGSAFGSIDPTNFVLGLLAGVAEELFFRGFLQTMIEFFLGGTVLARYVAPIPTALIFAWFHHFAYVGNPTAWLVIFAIGLAFGYIHAFSRDIGTPILAHVVNNAFAMAPAIVAILSANVLGIAVIGIVLAVVFFLTASQKPRRRG
jgi:membrane protease YdiL (CAAX protease family)